MVQIIKAPSFGTELGQAFGGGLGSGLQNLLQQHKTAAALQSLGIAPDLASQLSALDPASLREVVKGKIQEPSNAAFQQALSGIMGGGTPQQMDPKDQMGIQTQPQEPSPGISFDQEDPNAVQTATGGLGITPGIKPDLALRLAQLGLQKEALAQKEAGLSKKDIRERFAATKAERKEILEKARTARQDLQDLDRMEELQKEGKLDTPGWVEFLKRSGLDIPALMNPGSEEFNKIAVNFMRNAKQYLGARISNFELEQFLKTIPSLNQSPEGRQRVIANLKRISRSSLEYSKALKDIIAKEKGVPPHDLLEQIDSRVEKKMDKLAQEFKKDLSRPVPKGQRKLITAIESLLGESVGPLKAAATGAAIGSIFPAIGTGVGAGLGVASQYLPSLLSLLKSKENKE